MVPWLWSGRVDWRWTPASQAFVSCGVYLEKHPAEPPLTLRQVDPLIRELTHYRAYINHITKETPE